MSEKNLPDSEDRWTVSLSRTPSGRRLFYCGECGRHSPAPDKICPRGCGWDAHPQVAARFVEIRDWIRAEKIRSVGKGA